MDDAVEATITMVATRTTSIEVEVQQMMIAASGRGS
jgi:hypothetical protein